MAWELKNVEDQRHALINAYVSGESSMTELCYRFGISRKTAYKWLKRYLEIGQTGLLDRSRAPLTLPTRFNDNVIDMLINAKLKHLSWGPKKVLARLEREYPGIEWPSATRTYEIFKDHHLVTKRRIRRRVPATHPLGELNKSNDVWMADFKGWFLTKDNKKCEPLTITDGFSRYLIKCSHLESKTALNVWPVFKEAFEEYGLPNRIRTDNGPPFASVGVGRLTSLSVNFIKAGVTPEWINPGHPEENGRHERFHLTLKQTTANPAAETLSDQMIRLAEFQQEYNFERPHEALEMNNPADYYTVSERKWDGVLRSPEYGNGVKVRKVCHSGCIWLRQQHYYVSQALEGEYVSLTEGDGGLLMHYGPVYLGKIVEGKELEQPKLKPKDIVRRF